MIDSDDSLRLRLLPWLAVLLALAACQTPAPQHQVYVPAPPIHRQSLPAESAPGAPSVIAPQTPNPALVPAPVPITAPASAAEISGAAVLSLMKQAQQYRSAAQPDRAAGVLERALRIEPRNYFVWSALAQAYLEQKNFAQAESVAGKSNALARGNPYVELENWKTIAAARQANGDTAGAFDAGQRVEALQARIAAAGGG